MKDRFPLLLVSLLIFLGLAGAALVRGARRGEFADALSTYRSQPDGARGLYLFLEASGVPVERQQHDATVVSRSSTLVLLGPRFDTSAEHHAADGGVELSEDERRDLAENGLAALQVPHLSHEEQVALLTAVEAGRTLVYVPRAQAADPLLAALDVEFTPAEAPDELHTLVPPQPARLTLGVEQVQVRLTSTLLPPREAIVLLEDELGGVVAAQVPHGQGRVVVLGAPELAMNRALGRSDVAALWLALGQELTRAGHPLAFDEYHHGFTQERSVGEFARRYGLQYALAQALLAALVWAWGVRRFGRPRLPQEERRIGSTDALLASARLYQEGGHVRHAGAVIVKQLCAELGPRAGVSSGAPLETLAAGLEAHDHAPWAAQLRALGQRLPALAHERDLLHLAQAAARLRQQLTQKPRTTTS